MRYRLTTAMDRDFHPRHQREARRRLCHPEDARRADLEAIGRAFAAPSIDRDFESAHRTAPAEVRRRTCMAKPDSASGNSMVISAYLVAENHGPQVSEKGDRTG